MAKKMTYLFQMSNELITKISQHEMFPYFVPSSWEKGHEGKKVLVFTEYLFCAGYFTNSPVLVKRLILRRDFSRFDSLFEVGGGENKFKRKK